MLIGLYNRIFYVVTVANEFIRESEDGKLADRGISGTDADAVKKMRAEARFIRAYQYWAAMDLFGNVPYITETDMIGSTAPKQINRADLFKYVETELKALETELIGAKQNEYGRADQAACWALLARLYLNAQVYANENRYTDAITYAKKVISAGYDIESSWNNLFLADNHKSTKEFIWTINYDGNKTKNWGGMTFLVHASIGDNMNPKDFGVNGGWYGIRTTKAIPALYKYINTDSADKRAVFVQNKLEIDDLGKFSDGWAVAKYRNVDQAGKAGADLEGNFVDTDFPVFRLPEMYLVVAEAVLRGGAGATKAEAIGYLEKLRKRGFPTTTTTLSDIDLVYVLDERVRELLWEGHRRTDLVRYNLFTTNTYLWPWKGGVKEGRGVADHLKLYPLPTTDINANPNLVQNTGY
jgi:starch-binding outer membrane protein, SusD/RagB family